MVYLATRNNRTFWMCPSNLWCIQWVNNFLGTYRDSRKLKVFVPIYQNWASTLNGMDFSEETEVINLLAINIIREHSYEWGHDFNYKLRYSLYYSKTSTDKVFSTKCNWMTKNIKKNLEKKTVLKILCILFRNVKSLHMLRKSQQSFILMKATMKRNRLRQYLHQMKWIKTLNKAK